MDGVLVVDKPVGMTSFAVVKQVRKAAGTRRAGHGGTLDPLASGVLPVCLGEATKLAQFLLDGDKAYQATLCFGVETDSYDADGAVTERRPVVGLDEAAVRALLPRFTGTIQQRPPAFSALKHQGRPLYDYARAGEPIEAPMRMVQIHDLELLRFDGPQVVVLAVRCSKGTYVRSLAFDLGRALGPGAHLTALRRTVSGPFTLAAAHTLPALLAALDRGGADLPLVSLSDALDHLPRFAADAQTARALAQGKRLPCSVLLPLSPPVADPGPTGPTRFQVLAPDGSLLAVAERQPDDTLRTLRIFNGYRPAFD